MEVEINNRNQRRAAEVLASLGGMRSCGSQASLLWTAIAFVLGCGSSQGPANPLHVLPVPTTASTTESAPSSKPTYCSTADVPSPDTGDVIARVEVRGLHRVSAAEICSALQTKAGADIDAERVHRDVQNLWDSGLISNVDVESRVSATGRSVTFSIEERPVVRKWTIEGVHGPHKDDIVGLFGHSGDVFDQATLREDVAKAKDEYLDLGFRHADIQFHVDKAPKNEIDVSIVVNEGPPTVVKSITLHGVSKGKEAELLAIIDTGGGMFNAPGKPYHRDVLERDRLLMSSYYYDRGMVNVSVSEEEVALSPDGSAALTIEISEGPIYKVGKLHCKGDLADTEKKCLELFGVKSGEVFNRTHVAEGLERIRAFQDGAHRGIDVLPDTTLDPKKQTLDLSIVIKK